MVVHIVNIFHPSPYLHETLFALMEICVYRFFFSFSQTHHKIHIHLNLGWCKLGVLQWIQPNSIIDSRLVDVGKTLFSSVCDVLNISNGRATLFRMLPEFGSISNTMTTSIVYTLTQEYIPYNKIIPEHIGLDPSRKVT